MSESEQQDRYKELRKGTPGRPRVFKEPRWIRMRYESSTIDEARLLCRQCNITFCGFMRRALDIAVKLLKKRMEKFGDL